MQTFKRYLALAISAVVLLCFCFFLRSVDAASIKFTSSQCRKLFALHQKQGEGFIISKAIPKGPAMTDPAIFEPESCILVKPTQNQKSIETKVGLLVSDHVYYIDNKSKIIDVTDSYKNPYNNAAAICYYVSEKTREQRKSGFNMYNWAGGSFEYSTQEDGTMLINPDAKGKGPSGVIKDFESCSTGLGR